MTAITQDVPNPIEAKDPRHLLVAIVVMGVAFQVGHFIEHAVQFGVWVVGHRSTPWMSGISMDIVHFIGAGLFPVPEMSADPNAFKPRQMMMGMEIAHLIGNGIFLVTIASLYCLTPIKWVRWALYVETFHLYEHIMLVLSAWFIGKPIGLSTLFGGNTFLWSQEGAVGYRVFWHFAMNLVPLSLIMFGWMQEKRLKRP